MRRPIVAGNWKMHGTVAEARRLVEHLVSRLAASADVDVVVCPPFTALFAVAEAIRGSSIALGAQDVHWETGGAFTGEVSAEMLSEAGCRYGIVGHSERRTLCGETDDQVRRKAEALLAAGLHPIVCIGETLAQREAGETDAVLRRQINASLAGYGADWAQVVVAYEPIWAIGTGKTATIDQAQSAQAHVRSVLADLGGSELAQGTRIQYGGSLKPANAAGLLAQSDIDGGLVGGASLDASSFAEIVEAAAVAARSTS